MPRRARRPPPRSNHPGRPGGSFSQSEREQINLAVSERTRCNYCLAAHTAIGKMAGLDDEDLRKARDAGLGDGEIIELIAHAVFNLLTNFTNHAVETELDIPAVPPAGAARACRSDRESDDR